MSARFQILNAESAIKVIRTFFPFLALFCCFILTGCHLHDDIMYKTFSKTYYRHGQLWSGILKEPGIVQTYPCTGRVRFDSAGLIREFTLSSDHEILGHIIPGYSLVNIQDKIISITLSRPMEIQGYLIPGGKYIYVPFNTDKNGRLIYFVPEQDIVINGVPCMGLRQIELYPDGKLWVCFLSRDYEIDGILYYSGTLLLFDESGKAQEYSYELYQDIRKRMDL